MTPAAKMAAQACVNISETGRPRGNYTAVAVLKGDAGHLTYGRSQTTLASGGLAELLRRYLARDDARDAAALKPYLGRVAARDFSLDEDDTFKAALRVAGSDPAMQATQDTYFDERYWEPAEKAAAALQLSFALSVCVIYDSLVHGSWALIRDRTIAKVGRPGDEQAWVTAYVDERRAWFAGHSNKLLQRSVRRMDAFKELIAADNWDLELPFTYRGVVVDEASLGEVPLDDPIGLPDFDAS